MSYREAETGAWRHALQGENIDVDPSDIGRFDSLNFANSPTPPRSVGPRPQNPTRKGRRRDEDSRGEGGRPRAHTEEGWRAR